MVLSTNTATIIGAAIQALPVGAAVLVAWVGLGVWRVQVRGERHIKHAERALAHVCIAVEQIRQARRPVARIGLEGMTSDASLRRALTAARRERLDRAQAAWAQFAGSYRLVSFYQSAPIPSPDMAHELSECLLLLIQSSEHVAMIDSMELERSDPDYRDRRHERTGAMKVYLGELDGSDDISRRLNAALAAVERQMAPVLSGADGLPERMHR